MKHIKILSIALGIILLSACKKDNKPTVLDVTFATGSTIGYSNLTVYLLSDAHHSTADYVSKGTSDNDGKISFTVTPGQVYYVYNSSFPPVSPNGTYIVTGKFISQAQIDGSPAQTPVAQVGDNIEMDVNGDGVINPSDWVYKVTAPAAGTTSQVSVSLNAPIP
jgi:hypothetical protein